MSLKWTNSECIFFVSTKIYVVEYQFLHSTILLVVQHLAVQAYNQNVYFELMPGEVKNDHQVNKRHLHI